MNTTKLDQVLTECGEIALLKDGIHKLRVEVKNLKQSLQSAEGEIQSLQENQKETSAQVKENNEDIDFLFEDNEALRRGNIKLEAYTRRENVRIFNVGEEEDENTEELVRSVFVANLKIPADKVNDIRFEPTSSPRRFSLALGAGREKALASAGRSVILIG